MKLLPRLFLTTLLVGAPLLAGLAWFQQHARDRAAEETMAQLAQWFMQSGGRAACEAAPHTWVGTPGPHHHRRTEAERACPAGEPGCPPWRDSENMPPSPVVGWVDSAPPAHAPGSSWGEAPPPPFPRPGAPFELRMYAYDAAFDSQNRNAPSLPAAGLRQRLSNEATYVAEGHTGDGDGLRVLVRMPWTDGPCSVLLVTRHEAHPHDERNQLLPLQAFVVPPALALVSLLLAIGPVVRRMRRLSEEVKRAASAHYTLSVPVEGKDEVGELANAFNQAGKQIREYIAEQTRREKTLRDFLENTTHDVMIPLTVLQGHLSRLQEQAHPNSAAVVQEASQEAHYIASLVHNLSIAAKLEAGEPQVQHQPVNLNEVVQRAVARHQPVARQRDISVEYSVPETPVRVEGDVTLIEQALSNVVYNAVRYNRPEGHVAVLLIPGEGALTMRVVDDGPGMDEQDQSRMMERYVRGNAARSRTPHGQGLGLNIAYRVCVAHGWDIKLQRSEFGGLQVEFRIPVSSIAK